MLFLGGLDFLILVKRILVIKNEIGCGMKEKYFV